MFELMGIGQGKTHKVNQKENQKTVTFFGIRMELKWNYFDKME